MHFIPSFQRKHRKMDERVWYADRQIILISVHKLRRLYLAEIISYQQESGECCGESFEPLRSEGLCNYKPDNNTCDTFKWSLITSREGASTGCRRTEKPWKNSKDENRDETKRLSVNFHTGRSQIACHSAPNENEFLSAKSLVVGATFFLFPLCR